VSAVVYARLPEALKEDLQAWARDRGLTLNRALVELLEQALAAQTTSGSLAALEAKQARLEEQLAQTRARLREAELRLQASAEREQLRARIDRALAERARHQLASCPQCRQPVRGNDLLVSGHCPNCGKPITAFLTPRPQLGAPDKDEYLALLGALGALIGLAQTTPTPGSD
jgi:rubrerythrin